MEAVNLLTFSKYLRSRQRENIDIIAPRRPPPPANHKYAAYHHHHHLLHLTLGRCRLSVKLGHHAAQKSTGSPAVNRVNRPYSIHPKASVQLLAAVRKRFPRVTTVLYARYGDTAITNATINARIRYRTC